MLVQACLGMTIDAATMQVRIAHPVLPSKVDEIQIRRLYIGKSEIDFALRRAGKEVRIEVLRSSGDIKIVET